MSFKLERKRTDSTPYVLVDEENNYMQFKGESFHENIIEFYREIVEWLNSYMYTDFKTFTFDCELWYFNSSTTKLLLHMLAHMDSVIEATAKKVIVNWITTEDRELIIECGKDFQEDVENIEFNLVVA